MAIKSKKYSKEQYVSGEDIPSDILTLDEVGKPKKVEIETELKQDALEREAFMNEKVTVLLHDSEQEGANQVEVFTVNGVNQPVIRNRPQDVKRKYVEAMARCRVTKYRQMQADPTRPDSILMRSHTVPKYPFSVIHDPNPKGPQWLKEIMSQA